MRRSGSHTTHGTHPESSGNAPPTAARAHAWRGGYPYHAHFDLAAGSTHPPPIHMLIVRPGAPPTFAPPASRRQHNVLLTAAALCTPGERVFLTLFQTRRPQHNARHQSQRPAPYARHHHNARHHLRPAHRHHNNYPDRHILGDFDGYFFCGNHSTSTILQPTATTSMLLPHRTSSTTCSPVAATASSPTTTTTE